MLAAIGAVAADSAYASQALQQMAAAVTGTGLVYFTLRDLPLGAQVKQVQTWVKHLGTNEWIAHPPVHPAARDKMMSTLDDVLYLSSLRNRVVHDVWEPAPTSEHPDAIRGSAATRWGSRPDVEATVNTLRLLASTMFLAAAALGDAGFSLADRDAQSDPAPGSRVFADTERSHKQLTSRVADIRSGKLEGWHWVSA